MQVRRKLWLKNITDRNGSGMSIKEWCHHNQVSETSYYYWLKKIREEVMEASLTDANDSLPFVPILQNTTPAVCRTEKLDHPITGRNSAMTLTTRDMTIEFGNHISHELILNVLKVLKNA